jgi:PAS domain S-box-containing protein
MDYHKILDNLPMIIFVKGATDSLHPLFYNKEWYKYTGADPKDVQDNWLSVVYREDVPRVRKEISRAVLKGEPYELEVRIYHKESDSYRWFLSRSCPITENGKIELWVGTLIDVHDRKASVEQIEQEYEEKIQARLDKIKELEKELEIHRTAK